MSRAAIPGPADWTGDALERSGRWIVMLDNGHRAELAAALAAVREAGLPETGFGRAAFPLHRTAALLAGVAAELEDGCGAVRLRGLDAGAHGEADLRRIFWGIGTHLGTALYQNGAGEVMGEVRDETMGSGPVPEAPGKVMASRMRARSAGPLRFHTDRCDVIALLAARDSKAGGVSKLASIVTIHNEMLRRRPDLLELLFQPYWHRRPDAAEAARLGLHVALPVFGLRDNKLTSQYSRTFVEQAQEDPAVPRLTAAQDEALDLLAEIAEASCLHAPFAPGDIQLLNNHVVYHGRTAYEDDAADGKRRLLLRLWLAIPNSRALPPGFEVQWGAVESGALRGGTLQPDGRRSPVIAQEAKFVPAVA